MVDQKSGPRSKRQHDQQKLDSFEFAGKEKDRDQQERKQDEECLELAGEDTVYSGI
jgi:hypothetical protein